MRRESPRRRRHQDNRCLSEVSRDGLVLATNLGRFRDLERLSRQTAAGAVAFRQEVPALFYPIIATLKPFLEKSGASREDVDGMHQAWTKSVLLQVILWSYPYVREGDF